MGFARTPIRRITVAYGVTVLWLAAGPWTGCNTFQEPIITSVIDIKKITAWGESGFPARFLVRLNSPQTAQLAGR